MLDLRKVMCQSGTRRELFDIPSPARESNPALRFRRPPCARHTRKDSPNECPRQELNLVLDLRRVVCWSGTPRGLRSRALPPFRGHLPHEAGTARIAIA